MNRLGRWQSLSYQERQLNLQAGSRVAGRAVPRIFPFSLLRRIFAGRRVPGQSQLSKEKYAWAVQAASRLTKVLALQYPLRRAVYSWTVQLGVARGETGEFQAHAWVESQGAILLGGQWTPIYTGSIRK